MDLMTVNNGYGNETTQLTQTDPAAVAAAETAKARIQAAYIMAMHKPRNADQARDRILHACRRPGFAERVEYSKPVGGRAIRGPSIRFAEVALREWQNVLVETQTVYEDAYVRRVKVFVTDLETNATYSKEIQIQKTVERRNAGDREVLGRRTNTHGDTVYIVQATEDEIMNKEAAQVSKIIRNEGLRLIPQDIIDEALETARQTLRAKDAKDPDAAKKALLDAFSQIGVRPVDIEKYLGHRTDAITQAEIQDLRTIYRAIRDGEARWQDYVQAETDNTPSPALPEAPVPAGNGETSLRARFEKAVRNSRVKYGAMDSVYEYVSLAADANQCSEADVMAAAIKDMRGFMAGFMTWAKGEETLPDETSAGDEPQASPTKAETGSAADAEIADDPYGGIEREQGQTDNSYCTMEQLSQIEQLAKAHGKTSSSLVVMIKRDLNLNRMIELKYGMIPQVVAWIRS